jgi:uncharacterized membrane protein
MGKAPRAPVPTALYGGVLLACAIAWTILQMTLIGVDGANSKLASAVGRDGKGKLSALLYTAAVPLAFVDTRISYAIFVCVALLWLVPDRRIESVIGGE